MQELAVKTTSHKVWTYSRWFTTQLVHQFREDGCTNSAAALTFSTMIAVVPFFAIVYRILSLLPQFSGVGDTITEFVFETFLPGSSDLVLVKVQEFASKVNELTLIGILILILSTLYTLSRMEESFNQIWHVQSSRSGLSRWIFYWGVISFGIPMIAIAVTAASYDFGLDHLARLKAAPFMETLRGSIPPLAMLITFTFVYYAVPSCPVRFLHALLGGIVATILVSVTKTVFGWLVPLLQTQLIYGVFAALPLFVTGLYIVWLLILIGALFSRTLSLTPWEDQPDGVPAILKCVQILKLLHTAHLNGSTVADREILQSVPMTRIERNRIFDVLQRGKWLQAANHRSWSLGRSLETVTLWDLFVYLPESIDEEHVQGDSDVETRLRKFLAEGSTHLSISVAELT